MPRMQTILKLTNMNLNWLKKHYSCLLLQVLLGHSDYLLLGENIHPNNMLYVCQVHHLCQHKVYTIDLHLEDTNRLL